MICTSMMHSSNPNTDLCRLCLVRDNSLQSIFDTSQISSQEINEKIYVCLSIQIRKEDNFSKLICENCRKKVEEFYEFKKKSLCFQEILENLSTDERIEVTEEGIYGIQYIKEEEPEQDSIKVDDKEDEFIGSVDEVPEEEEDQSNWSIGSDESSPETSTQIESPILVAESVFLNKETSIAEEDRNLDVCATVEQDPLAGSKKNRSYICPLCSATCKSNFHVDLHIRRIHTHERLFKCKETGCNKAFYTRSSLKCHKAQVHSTNRPFICELCDKQFKKKGALTEHYKIHKDKENFCNYCNYGATNKWSVELHIRQKHTKEYKYICDLCGQGFFLKWILEKHLIVHNNGLPYVCKVCGEKFLTENKLAYHRTLGHIPDKPTSCVLCNKICRSDASLKFHVKRVHSNKRFECNECGLIVKNKSSLTNHLKIHSGIKKFKCSTCRKGFFSSSALKVHAVVHTRERKYICSLCNKAYSQKSSLNTHNKKMHSLLHNFIADNTLISDTSIKS